MKVSFIIPAYNCKNTLKRCVDSLKAIEKYSDVDIEVVLVDDGSSDGTSELCDQLGDIVIHQKNQGVSTARNNGIDKASGEYLAFIDSDDFIEAEKYAQLLQKLEADKNIDILVYGIFFEYYKKGKCYRKDDILPAIEGMKTREESMENLVSLYDSNVLSPVWNKLIKKEIITANAVYFKNDMFLYEDLEFSMRVLNQCKCCYYDRNPVYHYFIDESKGNSGGRIRRINSITELIKQIEPSVLMNDMDYIEQKKEILLKLYHVLIQQKINVSDRKTVTRLCEEYSKWIDENNLLESIHTSKTCMRLYQKKINIILLKREFTKIRHQVAILVKYFVGDFRKWKRKKSH